MPAASLPPSHGCPLPSAARRLADGQIYKDDNLKDEGSLGLTGGGGPLAQDPFTPQKPWQRHFLDAKEGEQNKAVAGQAGAAVWDGTPSGELS
jgi:hypothetical protein